MLRTQIKADREELARIARLCKVDHRHVGWMQDAMDKNKLGLPTTVSQAKCLGKMHRIKSKLTGCQLFKDNKLVLFRTLPDVPTGGNLTTTIVAHMFNREDVQQATDVYINVDGASDNICYHFIYGLAHLLRCAVRAGWPLRTIHFLRFKVGHTHNGLDGSFGVVSRHVYGSQRGGTTGVDVLSFSGFNKVVHSLSA